MLAESYYNMYKIKITGLRFFTVYGPWGRPDMAPLLFAVSIDRNFPIKIFNDGNLLRDFTYVDDIVAGITRVIQDDRTSVAHKIYNIGCSCPIKLMDFVETLQQALDKRAKIIMMPMQTGDVYQTYADTTALKRDYDYRPNTPLEIGIKEMVQWYKLHKNLFPK